MAPLRSHFDLAGLFAKVSRSDGRPLASWTTLVSRGDMDMEPDFDPDQIDKSVQFCTDGTNVASVAFFPVGILGAWLSQPPQNLPGAFLRERNCREETTGQSFVGP